VFVGGIFILLMYNVVIKLLEVYIPPALVDAKNIKQWLHKTGLFHFL